MSYYQTKQQIIEDAKRLVLASKITLKHPDMKHPIQEDDGRLEELYRALGTI